MERGPKRLTKGRASVSALLFQIGTSGQQQVDRVDVSSYDCPVERGLPRVCLWVQTRTPLQKELKDTTSALFTGPEKAAIPLLRSSVRLQTSLGVVETNPDIHAAQAGGGFEI